MKKELTEAWCCLNDVRSYSQKNEWYKKRWNEDKIKGAMEIIESFIDGKVLLAAWRKYDEQ